MLFVPESHYRNDERSLSVPSDVEEDQYISDKQRRIFCLDDSDLDDVLRSFAGGSDREDSDSDSDNGDMEYVIETNLLLLKEIAQRQRSNGSDSSELEDDVFYDDDDDKIKDRIAVVNISKNHNSDKQSNSLGGRLLAKVLSNRNYSLSSSPSISGSEFDSSELEDGVFFDDDDGKIKNDRITVANNSKNGDSDIQSNYRNHTLSSSPPISGSGSPGNSSRFIISNGEISRNFETNEMANRAVPAMRKIRIVLYHIWNLARNLVYKSRLMNEGR